MKKRFSVGSIALAAVVAVGIGGLSVPALGDSAADIVKKRQETMKQLGGHMKEIKKFAETGDGSAADVARRAGEINTISMKIPELFPSGTSLEQVTKPETGAKPEIWKEFDKFKAAAGNLGDLSNKLQTTASNGGDQQAIAAAFGEMGKEGCGGCHKPYRKKLEK